MLRVSTKARYALRLMLEIAHCGDSEEPVSLATVSGNTQISRGYLEQVAQSLRSAGLLRSLSGRHGGYRLAAPASEITVGQIFQALVGPVCLVDCIYDPDSCPRASRCECRVVYRIVNESIVDALGNHTLADLLDPKWMREHRDLPRPDHCDDERPSGFGCMPCGGVGTPQDPD